MMSTKKAPYLRAQMRSKRQQMIRENHLVPIVTRASGTRKRHRIRFVPTVTAKLIMTVIGTVAFALAFRYFAWFLYVVMGG